MEFVQGGNLEVLLYDTQKKSDHRIAERSAAFYAGQLILALEYLHRNDIVHRDLKPANLLIDRRGYVKVADFGGAIMLNNQSKSKICFSPPYAAPELLLGKSHGKAVDYWALGVLIYEMVAGKHPFNDAAIDDMRHGKQPNFDFPDWMSESCRSMIENCLTPDTSKRMESFENIKEHQWLIDCDIDWAALEGQTATAPWVPHIDNPTDLSYFPRSPLSLFYEDTMEDNSTCESNYLY